MKKRVLSLVLCFVLCLSLCPTAAFADGEDGHIHEQEEQAPLVVSATMAPETTETPVEPEAEPTPEPTAAPVAEPEAPVVDEAVAAVQARIDALPAVDSVTAEDYDAVQNAYDAYDALTAEQQALITGAEAFEALFNWFNSQVAVLDEGCTYDENGFCTNVDYTDNKHDYKNCYEPAKEVSEGNYEISNAGQLYWFANNSLISRNRTWNATLTADITVNSGTFDANGNYTVGDEAATPRKLVRIGQSNSEYAGTFDGDGHTISGLYHYASGKTGNVGLFSANGATIQNLTIDNMYISAPQSTVGLIVGENCSVTVKNVTVQNSYIISRESEQVGAIVAWLKGGSVSNCRSINNVVQGQKNNVGAIVGWNNGGAVENCYSTSTVKVGNNPVSKVVGNGTAKNCYYLAEKETESQNGVAGKTAAQFKSGEVAYLLNGSKDNGTWKQTIGTDDFPNFTGGAVYETSPCPSYTNNASNLYKEHDKVKGTCTVCGDGCKHEKWTDGVCDDCGETAVAKMTKGDTTGYFMDLGEALLAAAADNNCTVTVLENVSSDVTVDLSRYSANITLDLNGKTVAKLSYEYGYESCPLTVKDSGSGGTLGDLTLKHSTVTLTGGTVTALNMTGRNASISGGTVTTLVAKDSAKVGVSGGTVTTLNMTGGTVTLSGGTVNTVTLQGSADGWNKGTLNMTGGNVTTITSGTNAAVNVSNGTVKTLNMTDGEASLTGGSYERITGAETITLGDLLPAGKVFAKGSDVKSDSTKLTSDGIDLTGYSITDCDHSSGVDAVGCCVNCGADREVIIVQANDTETKYATAAEAFAAAKGYTSATVTLRKDVHASETITLETGTITLDLGGHTLSGGGQKVLDLTGSAALTVNADLGGTIRNTYTEWNAPIAVSGEARLTLASAQVTSDTNGDLTLSGGETTITAGANIQVNASISNGKLTVTGGTMEKLAASGGEVSLSGGTFNEIKASGSVASCYALLAEGYAFAKKSDAETLVNGAVAKLTNVTVVPHSAHDYSAETGMCACGLVRVAQIGDVYYTSLTDALTAVGEGQTIKLLANVTAPADGENSKLDLSAKSNVTIDLNGKTLSGAGNLTITGNVTITDTGTATPGAVTAVSEKSVIIAGDVTVAGNATFPGNVMVPTGGKLTVSGGTFGTMSDTTGSGTVTIAGGSATITGGTFHIVATTGGSLTISGGAFGSWPNEEGGEPIGGVFPNGGTVTMTAGAIGGQLLAENASSVTISGGTIKVLNLGGTGSHTISGGTATTVNVTPGGIIKMTAGKVTTMNIAAIPQEGTTATLENFTISGGEIDTLTLGAADVTTYTDIKKGLTGGSFGKIEILGGTLPAVRELLAAGYAFKNSSGFVLWGGAQGASIENVNVAKCVHQNTAPGSECQYCGQLLVAQLVAADGKTSFYTSFAEAYAAASTTGESVITLLANGGKAGTSLSVDKAFRLLLGTYELKDKLVIAANGSLEVGNGSGTMAAIEQTGGTLSVETAATVQSLTVSGGTTKLQAGTYTSITTSNGITADDLLDNGYAYYKTAADGSKTWLTVTNETELQNVSVGRIPLLDITLTASPASLTYGDDLTLTASSVDGADYEWYEVAGETETKIEGATGASYEDTKPNAGSHTYRCKVTKDGYTVTLDKTVTVAKADIPGDDIHAPEAITGLTYNGGEQMLISAGSVDGSIGEIKYKLGADGTYGTDASALKGTDADDYTIYYYVDGGTNYNDIGSADAPREIKVTIAPRDLVASVAVPEYFVSISSDDLAYSGQPQAPTFTLTLNHRNEISATETRVDTLETLVPGTDYTQSVTKKTDIGTYTAGFTGKGNYTGTATVDWNIVKAPAPTATDGSLTVYNQIAYTYTVDLASLLPVLPAGCEYGTLTYALNAVGEGDDDSKITVEGYLDGRTLTNGTLTLPVPFVDSTDTGAIAALRVTVEAENYETFTLTLNVSRANRVSPIDVGAPLDGLTKDNVTGDDREALEDLLDDLDGYLAQNPGEGEKKELEDFKKEAEELIERLDDAKAAMENDAIGAADDIDASNAEPGHKGRLRSAKRAIQDALDTYGPNYTAAEKAALNEKLARINAALAAIEKLEENAKNDQTDKPVKTGDEAMPILWIVLIVVAAGCVVVLLAARRKKK